MTAATVLLLAVPIEPLAKVSSTEPLLVFATVKAALLRIKLRHEPASSGVFVVPLWIAATGLVFSLPPVAWEAMRLFA